MGLLIAYEPLNFKKFNLGKSFAAMTDFSLTKAVNANSTGGTVEVKVRGETVSYTLADTVVKDFYELEGSPGAKSWTTTFGGRYLTTEDGILSDGSIKYLSVGATGAGEAGFNFVLKGVSFQVNRVEHAFANDNPDPSLRLLKRGLEREDGLIGSSGDDWLNGYRANDVIRGNAGNDTLYGGEKHDAIHGGRGDDIVNGHEGDDSLLGAKGDDSLKGGPGNDYLHGGPGNDRLTGRTGADVFEFRANGGTDIIDDFQVGKDELLLDSRLWGGGKTVQEVLDEYAVDTGSGVELTFENGETLYVWAVRWGRGLDIPDLVDDILIV